jgi:hypothetical protein
VDLHNPATRPRASRVEPRRSRSEAIGADLATRPPSVGSVPVATVADRSLPSSSAWALPTLAPNVRPPAVKRAREAAWVRRFRKGRENAAGQLKIARPTLVPLSEGGRRELDTMTMQRRFAYGWLYAGSPPVGLVWCLARAHLASPQETASARLYGPRMCGLVDRRAGREHA